ncbi:hypothetical protein D9756_004360 [Leucocoprinus leucothites]|uniref:Uncharacterized protein n=1 Tax=Leucocoprinus leucothites TaxID=201217 RepID=A0A8H5D9V9_9AGAR|nr:hypothetical protein D9756_004360 [Leucoagaricus leucothites]
MDAMQIIIRCEQKPEASDTPIASFLLLSTLPSGSIERCAFISRLTINKMNTKISTKRSPHSRPKIASSTSPAQASLTPSYSLTVSSSQLPSPLVPPSHPGTSTPLLGYTSPIRTISPQISNLGRPSRETVKAIAPHMLGERGAQKRSSSRSKQSFSMPSKAHHQLPLNDRNERSIHKSHHQLPEPGSVSNSGGKRKLKPSPLRVTVVCENDSGSELLPGLSSPATSGNEQAVRPLTDSDCPQVSLQARTQPHFDMDPRPSPTISLLSHTRESSDSSTTSASSEETTSCASSLTSGDEDNTKANTPSPRRPRSLRWESSNILM